MALEVRPARAEDFRALVREMPPVRVKAWAGVEDGEVVAIGGIAFSGDGVFQAFFDVKDDETRRRYPVTLYKAARRLLKEAKDMGIPCLAAFAKSDWEPSVRFLLRLGFVPMADGSGMFVAGTGADQW